MSVDRAGGLNSPEAFADLYHLEWRCKPNFRSPSQFRFFRKRHHGFLLEWSMLYR